MAELAREVEGAPEELTAGGGASGMDTSGGKRQLRQLEARAAVEEDLMMRVPLSKVMGLSTRIVGIWTLYTGRRVSTVQDLITRELVSSSRAHPYTVRPH